MLVNGDCQWITTLHYAFQDENYLVGVGHQELIRTLSNGISLKGFDSFMLPLKNE